jgi:hypothetical protein
MFVIFLFLKMMQYPMTIIIQPVLNSATSWSSVVINALWRGDNLEMGLLISITENIMFFL